MSQSIAFNIAKVRQRIREAEEKFGRPPGCVTLIAVSKTRPAAMIREAAAAGVQDIGESYLQEALEKLAELGDLPVTWHFIGPIQSNKTRPIAEHFDWVHSVDRLKIARRLSDQRPPQLPPLQVCLQVNISGESSKSGLTLEELPEVAAAVVTLPRLQLRGLMAVPRAGEDEAAQRAAFRMLADAAGRLQDIAPALDTLSMGMSGDMEAAIAEGATQVRIGSAIFGRRSP